MKRNQRHINNPDAQKNYWILSWNLKPEQARKKHFGRMEKISVWTGYDAVIVIHDNGIMLRRRKSLFFVEMRSEIFRGERSGQAPTKSPTVQEKDMCM